MKGKLYGIKGRNLMHHVIVLFFFLSDNLTTFLLLSLCSQLLLPEKCFLFPVSLHISPSLYLFLDNVLMQKVSSLCHATFLLQLAVQYVFYLARPSQNIIYIYLYKRYIKVIC